MNELIKQAAEDCHLKHGIGKTGGYYSIIVNHFLSFAKDNGDDANNLFEQTQKEISEGIAFYLSADINRQIDYVSSEWKKAISKAIALGAAKERERNGDGGSI